MLTITPDAEKWITTQLEKSQAPDGFAMRLDEKEGQIQMGLGEPKDEDKIFDSEGQTYLAVGPKAAVALEHKSLCTQDTEQGASLAIAPAPPSA